MKPYIPRAPLNMILYLLCLKQWYEAAYFENTCKLKTASSLCHKSLRRASCFDDPNFLLWSRYFFLYQKMGWWTYKLNIELNFFHIKVWVFHIFLLWLFTMLWFAGWISYSRWKFIKLIKNWKMVLPQCYSPRP